MTDKLVVNVALTGCVAHKADNPALPVTPEEVAADARRCADQGATVFHLHARDGHGNPVFGAGHYRRYVDAVREAVPGAVVCVSCSGRHFTDFEERADALLAGPDTASLTLGSVDFEHGTAVYPRHQVKALARRMRDMGIIPECEIFDWGHLYRLFDLYAYDRLFQVWTNVIFGVHVPVYFHSDHFAQSLTVLGVPWAFGGVGEEQWPANRAAIEAGGHVRTGLEDNLRLSKYELATNPVLVGRAVGYARSLGREPATFEETRQILGIKEGE